MKILIGALLLAASVGSVGCVVVEPATCSGQAGVNCGANCPTLCNTGGSSLTYASVSGATVYSVDPGAATVIGGGTAGFALVGAGGGSWRLVWSDSGNTSFSEFFGTVWTPGTFGTITPGCSGDCSSLSGNDSLSTAPTVDGASERIDFDSVASSDPVGFDFTVSSEPIDLDLYINGQYFVANVFFTSGGVVLSPGVVPFGAQSP